MSTNPTVRNLSNIILIGPMGAGKTSVGKALANIMRHIFMDADQELETRMGVDIPWIFEIEGEAGFRKRETDVLQTLTKLHHIVLSVGGGAVLSPINRQYMHQNGIIIYLRVSIEQQMQRLKTAKNSRPLLATDNLEEKLMELNAVRNPLYDALADLSYNTDGRTPMELATVIATDIHHFTLQKGESA